MAITGEQYTASKQKEEERINKIIPEVDDLITKVLIGDFKVHDRIKWGKLK